MNIAIRLFLGYFLVVGVAAWFVLNIFVHEVKPGVRQATEDTMVDAANLLAELAAPELATGKIDNGAFARAVHKAQQREPDAAIWNFRKETIDLRVYLTDARGIVIYDSEGAALNEDYSKWRDVAKVLRGEYGARSTRDDPHDSTSTVMYVAAPVLWQDRLIGVISVAKPVASVTPYVEQARLRVQRAGYILLAVSAAIGLLFTFWLTWSLNQLRAYAQAVANGEKVMPPTLGGKQLSELAKALATMRTRLDGKQYVETYVQTLAHEMKSPLSAVRGAAELLQEYPAQEDRQRFARNICEQTSRMQQIIERLLELARLEQLQMPEKLADIQIAELVATVVDSRCTQLADRGLHVDVVGDGSATVQGDAFLLQQALGNLLDNAIAFSPMQSAIAIRIGIEAGFHSLKVIDHGPGIPEFALPQVFDRFYSLPRPATGTKSTGLGLAFVQEIAKIHGGDARLSNAPEGGAIAELLLP